MHRAVSCRPVPKLKDSMRSLGAKRLMEVTNAVKFQQLDGGEQLFAEGDESLVRA